MSQEYEAERTLSSDDVATALRQLADGVAAGSVAVDSEAGPVAVDVPADLTFEVELEADEDEVELEAELEWETDAADASAIRELDGSGGSDADQAGTAVVDQDAESQADGTDESTSEEGTESTAEQATGSATDLVDLVGPATDPAAPTDAPESEARFELFRDAADEWRWRLRHRNGNVIADGGEGYGRKATAINGIESVKSNAPHAVVQEESQ